MTGIDDLIICPRCLKSMGEIDTMICPHCGYDERKDNGNDSKILFNKI